MSSVEILGSLIILYLLANGIYIATLIIDHDIMFANGFLVKHLIISILFLPASLVVLLAIIVFHIVVLIIVGITMICRMANISKFLNRRLF